MKRIYSHAPTAEKEKPREKRAQTSFGFSNEAAQENGRATENARATINVSLDTGKVDIFAQAETVFWDSDQETIKAVRKFAVGGTTGNDTAVVEILFINKIAEAADIYFDVTPTSYRTDLVQTRLTGGGDPVRVPAASSGAPTTTKLGEMARRLSYFGFFWGVVAIPVAA